MFPGKFRLRNFGVCILLLLLIYLLSLTYSYLLYEKVDMSAAHDVDTPSSPPVNTSDCMNSSLLTFPKSALEDELDRLGKLTDLVMGDLGLTYYPTDATLLGLMRNGRVATDRDLDYNIHVTYATCKSVLYSLKKAFENRGSVLNYFKVREAYLRVKNGTSINRKLGIYAMVRVNREFGTFNTGVDFSCVFMDDSNGPHFVTHKGLLTPIPDGVYPLRKCLMYGRSVACPGDGYAYLKALTPRYDGCAVFPHCMARDVNRVYKGCLTPHKIVPLANFIKSTSLLERCGFTSLVKHFETEPLCRKEYTPACDNETGLCFIQKFYD
eukprot:Tbor_TRINITY_DN5464_c0_g1::TRINITY_DN5464_c0_g1_i3::g.25299::m.25299